MTRPRWSTLALALSAAGCGSKAPDQPPPQQQPPPQRGSAKTTEPVPLGFVPGAGSQYVTPPTPPTEQLDKIGAAKTDADDLFGIAGGAVVTSGPKPDDVQQAPWFLFDQDNASKYAQLGTTKELPPIELALADQVELQTVALDYVRDAVQDHVPRRIHIDASDDDKTWTPIIDAELPMPPADDVKLLTKKVVPARFVRVSLLGTNALKAGDGVQEIQELRAYGKRTTSEPPPSPTGTYKIDGVGTLHLTQTGSIVTGCIDGKKTRIAGAFDGRVLRFAIAEPGANDNGPVSMTFSKAGVFWGTWPGGIEAHAFMVVHDGKKTSDKGGACPGERKSWIGAELDANGRARLYGVVFDPESDALRDEAKPQLDQLVAVMKAQPKLAIRIEASTDAVATPPHNHILSAKQAVAVQQYLVAAGIDAGRIAMKGLGANIPIAPNTTPLGRAQNRRIEIVKTNP